MNINDIRFALSLCRSVGWFYSQKDFRALLSYEPQGCFVAVSGHRRLGLVTTISYGTFGWIGNLVVAKHAQKRGIGSQLLTTAMKYLEKSVPTVFLFSYHDLMWFYEKFGFRKKDGHITLVCHCNTVQSTPTTFQRLDTGKNFFDDIAALDKQYFHGDRKRVLERIFRETPELVFVLTCAKKTAISGYLLVKGDKRVGFEIGPLCAIDDTEAIRLLNLFLCSPICKSHVKIYITVPEHKERFLCYLYSRGFKKVWNLVLMVRGKDIAFGKEQFAFGSIEKG